MSVVVQKYGGSSVADIEKIKRVAQRVVRTRELGHGVVAVVSAMGDTTNNLLALAGEIAKSPPGRELDMLVTVGERITMALLAMAIHELGHESVSFTGSQSGILTTASHSGARVVEVRPYRIEDELEKGKIVIVAGYQGVSYQREITTLGRGGSDTTAIALAAALRAEYCEICSDVDGVWTSDPRKIPEARKIDSLTHDEMLEMAIAGAKVLNADAVEYARRNGIAIYARSTFGGTEQTGTLVRLDLDPNRGGITAIACRTDLFEFIGSRPSTTALQEQARAKGFPAPFLLEATGDRVRLVYCTENAQDAKAMVQWFQTQSPEGNLTPAMGLVTLIGPGIFPGSPLLESLLEGTDRAGILSQRTSSGTCQLFLPPENTQDTASLLHKRAFPLH